MSATRFALRRWRLQRPLVTIVIILATTFAGFITPQNPFDAATLNLMDGFTPPGEAGAGSGMKFSPRRRQSGTRHVFGDPLRIARIAVDRHGFGDLLAAARRDARTGRRIHRRPDRGADHARCRHPAVVSGHSRRAAGVRHCPRPDPSFAARADDLHRHDGGDRPVELGAVCAHGARVDAGGEAQGVCRCGPRDRAARLSGDDQARPAERRGSRAGDRDHQSCACRAGGSDAVVPRRRHAADAAFARHADQGRPAVPVLRRVVDPAVPVGCAGDSSPSRSTCSATGCAMRSIPGSDD